MTLNNWFETLKQRFTKAGVRRRQRPAYAQWTAGEVLEQRTLLSASPLTDELLVNQTVDGVQKITAQNGPAAAAAVDGSTVVAWHAADATTDSWDIKARRFAPDGSPSGDAFQVNTVTTGVQNNSSVTMADDGSFLVTWESRDDERPQLTYIESPLSGTALFGQRYSANGDRIGGEFQINSSVFLDQVDASATFLPDGGFAVTWSGFGVGDNSGVFLRIFDSSGNPVTDELRANEMDGGVQRSPAITADANGGIVVAWSGPGTGGDNSIYARRFSAVGVPVENEFVVNEQVTQGMSQPNLRDAPFVIGDDEGGFAVAWEGRGTNSAYDIYFRHFDADDDPVTPEVRANEWTRGRQRSASIVTTEGGYVVSWDGWGEGDRNGVYYREFDHSGSAVGHEQRVSQTVNGRQRAATVVPTNDGFAVSWSGAGNGDSSGVFHRRYEYTASNLPPTLNHIGQKMVYQGNRLKFVVRANDPDLPNDTLTYSLDSGAPAGAFIHPMTGAFRWTTTAETVPDVYEATVLVTDSAGAKDSETIAITVGRMNADPILAPIGNKTAQPGERLTFTATATDADLPADVLTFSLGSDAPAGATINPTTGFFSWSPMAADEPYSVSVTIRVADMAGATDFETIIIGVGEVNHPPVLSAIGDKTVGEEQELTFTAAATDSNLPDDTLTYSLDPDAPVTASIDPVTGLFSWTPSEANGPGTFNITVRVTDSSGESDHETIMVSVTDENRSPELAAIGDRVVSINQRLEFIATATDPDLPTSALIFSLDPGAPVGAAITPGTGMFTWTPTETVPPGTYEVTVRVTDGSGASDFETISIDVVTSNSPPVLAPVGNMNVSQGEELTFVANATDADIPLQVLTFSLDPGAPTGASIDPVTGEFSWPTTLADSQGTYVITVRVTDSVGASDFETISVQIAGISTSGVTIDGDFDDWDSLPSYTDPTDDQHDTDGGGPDTIPGYVDHPDVDLLEYKFTHDAENLYAYIRATGEIGATQTAAAGRAGRYYAIVTIDVDNDLSTGYDLYDGGYYPTTGGYDMNMEAEFYDGTLNTVHYLSHDAANDTENMQDFSDLTQGGYSGLRDLPGDGGGLPEYPVGTVTPASGNYDNYTQWVYNENVPNDPNDDTVRLVEDKGPAYTGIASVAVSADGHELEMKAPFKGFLKDQFGNDNVALGKTINISFSLEASGELSNEATPDNPNGEWASDTGDPIIGYVLTDPNQPPSPTALDTYVAMADPSYGYTPAAPIVGAGYTAHVLDMTSQTWMDDTVVTNPEWQHWVTVIVPDGATSSTAVLNIDGGSYSATPPSSPSDIDRVAMETALQTGMIVVNLPTVPNQPQVFLEEGMARYEDEIIAYTFDKYLETGNDNYPLLLPMVKSAVATMTTVQDYASTNPFSIDDFIVTGESKRGWTTWLTAAVDSRVKAIVPKVIDVLNMGEQMPHHRSNYEGVTDAIYQGYSTSIRDYVELNVIQRLDDPEAESLLEIVDPYEYRDRLTLPKFLLNAAGDQFFVPDSGQFYLNDLQGPTYVRYVPNADHRLNDEAHRSADNFIAAVSAGSVLPRFDWDIEAAGSLIRVNTDQSPVEVRMWQATNPNSLDFRQQTFGANWTSSVLTDQGGGEYTAQVPAPATGGTAFFVELTYNVDGRTLIFTTEVSIVEPV